MERDWQEWRKLHPGEDVLEVAFYAGYRIGYEQGAGYDRLPSEPDPWEDDAEETDERVLGRPGVYRFDVLGRPERVS